MTSSHVVEFDPQRLHAQLDQLCDFLGEIATAAIAQSAAVHRLAQAVEDHLAGPSLCVRCRNDLAPKGASHRREASSERGRG